jgi:hypothetical protein
LSWSSSSLLGSLAQITQALPGVGTDKGADPTHMVAMHKQRQVVEANRSP